MKKIFTLLMLCLALVACNDHRPLCVVIAKPMVHHTIDNDEYYIITRSIYNNKKKIARVSTSAYLMYQIGDTIPELFNAHE